MTIGSSSITSGLNNTSCDTFTAKTLRLCTDIASGRLYKHTECDILQRLSDSGVTRYWVACSLSRGLVELARNSPALMLQPASCGGHASMEQIWETARCRLRPEFDATMSVRRWSYAHRRRRKDKKNRDWEDIPEIHTSLKAGSEIRGRDQEPGRKILRQYSVHCQPKPGVMLILGREIWKETGHCMHICNEMLL